MFCVSPFHCNKIQNSYLVIIVSLHFNGGAHSGINHFITWFSTLFTYLNHSIVISISFCRNVLQFCRYLKWNIEVNKWKLLNLLESNHIHNLRMKNTNVRLQKLLTDRIVHSWVHFKSKLHIIPFDSIYYNYTISFL